MWDWLLSVILLVTALYWYLTLHHGYWRSKGVYTLPGCLPGVGHMWNAITLKKNASYIHSETYGKVKNQPAVGIYNFRKPALVVRDLNLVKAVLIGEFSNFHDNNIVSDEKLDPLISKNPFVLTGEKWKEVRQKVSPAFSPLRIKAMFPMIQRVCEDFNQYMEKRLNEDIDVNHVAGFFTSEVVAKCAFGLDGNIFNNPKAEFYNMGMKIWTESLYNPFMLFVIFNFPIINKILRKSLVPKDVSEYFLSTIQQAAEYRKKNPEKVPDNDFLQYVLQRNKEFTIEDVAALSLIFYTDGFETSANSASFLIYELTVNPEIQEAVRKEIKSMKEFNYDNIIALPLLDRVFNESLRKYGPFSLLKLCTKDTVLFADGNSYPVKKGQEVAIPVYGIQHDPEIYPDPEKFDPDRFLPENVERRHPLSFMSFGAGPRLCIGYRFATCQVKMLVANILTNFKLVKCPKTVEKMKLLPQQLLPVSEKGIWVRFQKL